MIKYVVRPSAARAVLIVPLTDGLKAVPFKERS